MPSLKMQNYQDSVASFRIHIRCVNPRVKLQARAIANDCYKFILDMSTNAGIVSDALKYVSQKTEQVNTLQKMEDRLEATAGIY